MGSVILNKKGISIDGGYKVLLCASLFYFRIPEEYWQDRINMLKNAGYNCVDIYFPWNYHEEGDGCWNFEGSRDVDKFLRMVSDAGLYIIARPGPYICSEWDGGALPARICGGGFNIRTNDSAYLHEVKKWFDRILPVIAKYQITNGGGKVILMQLENELDFFDCGDVDGYISALRDMSLLHGITVPLFACAGQSDAQKAGGLVKGVEATYNFYPDSRDVDFDKVILNFNELLKANDKPLLVSETNRDHFLLRRELAAGAKLLGAYNQVAGSNFGFTSSVNNWGSPLAFLSTKYDFGSLITTLGEYSPEIYNARELSLVLTALGEELAAAVSDNTVNAVSESNNIVRPLNALRLKSGGIIISAANYSEKTELLNITAGRYKFKAEAGSFSAPFLLIDTDLKPLGINCKINYSANEILSIGKDVIAFKKTGVCAVSVNIGGKDYLAETDIKTGGIKIEFWDGGDISRIEGFGNGYSKKHETAEIPAVNIEKKKPVFQEIKNNGELNLEALGLTHGYVRYTAENFPKGLFLEDAADIVSVSIDGKYMESCIADGNCLLYNGGKTAEIRAEAWGHSNFDDARRKSLRISSKKGIRGIYAVENRIEEKLFKFKLLDNFMTPDVDTEHSVLCPVLGVSKWNSTRQPVICMYTFKAKREFDKLYIKVSDKVESAVYAGGKLVGKGDYGYIDLTGHTKKGKDTDISVVYRKENWAVDCGRVETFDLRRLITATSKLNENDLVLIDTNSGNKTVNLPIKLEKGCEYTGQVVLNGAGCRELRVKLKDAKATFVLDGKVVGRIMGEWEKSPLITGGSATDIYLPGEWIKRGGGLLKFYIESLGENPEIISLCEINKNK